jgi:hypothetical protein
MMKSSTNKILGVLLAVLVAAIVLPRVMPEDKGYPERFAEVDTAKVSRIEISKADARVLLERRNGAWQVSEPVNWKADANAVTRLLAELTTAGAVALVNANKDGEADSRYELDDAGATKLGVFAGSEELLALRVGKASQDFSTGFVRFEDKQKIYRSGTNLSGKVPAQPARWLDKVIYKEEEASLAAIELKREDGRLNFARPDSVWEAEWMPEKGRGWKSESLNEGNFNAVRNGLQSLRLSDLASAEQAALLEEAPLEFECTVLLKDGRNHRIRWKLLESESSKAFCKVDDFEPWFSLYKSSLERLNKAPEEFRLQ